MKSVPQPAPDAIPINEPQTTTLEPGEVATFRWTPSKRSTPGFVVPTLAASKYRECSYTVWFDDQKRFGPAAVPPTDVDDTAVTFLPAYEFEEELRVRVANVSDSTPREMTVQPIGFERAEGSE